METEFERIQTAPLEIISSISERVGNISLHIKSELQFLANFSTLTSVIALTALMNYCPRCGEWQGAGSEGKGPKAPTYDIPPPPARLIKAISTPITSSPDLNNTMDRNSAKLTSNSGILKTPGEMDGKPATLRHQPPSNAHGRKIDTYYDGTPDPISRPHAHFSEFVRGDGEKVPLYDRPVSSEPRFDSEVNVTYEETEGGYTWKPKPQS